MATATPLNASLRSLSAMPDAMPDPLSVCVIGLGYVGLPTAAIIANRGLSVTGVDTNDAVTDAINKGDTPIVEPDLDILVKSAVVSGNLKAAASPGAADVFILAVPTPFKENHVPDLGYLESAIESVASVLQPGNLVILESTSPVGTTEQIAQWIRELRSDLSPSGSGQEVNLYIAHSPERVLPGRVLIELVDNDRVIGGLSPDCAQKAAAFYKLFVRGACHLTSARTAELVKLAENAYRDANIAFANEMSLVCDELGVDVWEMRDLANRHPRVDILMPGPGVGGHCIAVDPWFIIDSAREATPLLQAARHVNDGRPGSVVERILSIVNRRAASSVACLGLAYKADIDDLRESPSVEIVRDFANRFEGQVLVAEPYVEELPEDLAGAQNIQLADLGTCLDGSGIIVLLTDHEEFRDIPEARLSDKTIIDTRGAWRAHTTAESGE